MDLVDSLEQAVRRAASALVAEGRLPAGLDFGGIAVEPADGEGRGDFSCNAGLALAGAVGLPPRRLAALLAGRLDDGLARAEVGGPGFLNLTIAPKAWSGMLADLLAAGGRYGAGGPGGERRMTITFRPTDPGDPLPVSPARREAVGTALANMLDHLGFRADRRFRAAEEEADLEHFPEKLIDFSAKKMRRNKELERKCDSEKSHFALTVRLGPLLAVGGGAACLPVGEVDDAVRLGMLMQPAAAPLHLDLDLLADPAHRNPVFHLHYAHARCCALRQRGAAAGLAGAGPDLWDVSAFEDGGARLILRLLALYPRQIALAAGLAEPYRLAQHLHALAGALHEQYSRSLRCSHLRFVRDDDRLLTGARLALVRGVETVLKSGLALLGSSAPEEMR